MAGLADFDQRAGDQVGRAGVIALVAGAVAGDAGDFSEGLGDLLAVGLVG